MTACGLFSGTGQWIRIGEELDGAKRRMILEENMFKAAKDLRLEQRVGFQQDNVSEDQLRATLGISSSSPRQVKSHYQNPLELDWIFGTMTRLKNKNIYMC